MKRVVVIFGALLLVGYLTALVVPLDPQEQRPGTRLDGERINPQLHDWSVLTGQNKIYVQTQTWYLVPHSVTTTSWVTDNELYVPCAHCDSKLWPKNVARNPNVTLKLGNKLYDRRAVKITDPLETRRLLQIPGHGDLPGVAVFRMDPR